MVKGLPGGLGAPVLLLSSRQQGTGISLGLVVPLVLSALPLENTGMDILNTVASNITLAFPCCRSLAVFPAIPNNIWVFCLQPTKLRAALQVVPRALGFSVHLAFPCLSPYTRIFVSVFRLKLLRARGFGGGREPLGSAQTFGGE